MLDFLRFIGSLLLVLWRYVNTRYITRLRHLYGHLALRIVRNQTLFIMIPLTVGFTLSYPSLCALLSSGEQLEFEYITELYPAAPSVHAVGSLPQMEVKQIWFQPESLVDWDKSMDQGALDPKFLQEVLQVQESMMKNIPQDSVFVHSPLSSGEWDKSISQKESIGLLSGGVSVNGIMKSAQALRLLMMYTTDQKYGEIWDENFKSLSNNTDVHFTFEQAQNEPLRSDYILEFTRMTFADHLIVSSCYVLVVIYTLISLNNLTMVTSKCGLLLAFVTEMVLSIFSAATLTTVFFTEVDFYEIPLHLLPFLVIVCGVENMFRLVSVISEIPGEMNVAYRLSKGLERSGLTSTFVMTVDLLILRVCYPYVIPNSKIFCVFTGFALIFSHILHLTFFASVLSIDIHRLELHDLIDDTNTESSTFKEYTRKISLPFSTKITGFLLIISFIVCLNLRWMGGSYGSTDEISDSANFLTKKVFSGDIIQAIGLKASHQKVLVSIDAPVTASFASNTIMNGFRLHTSYKFDIFYILEFLTLLILTLSLSMIALKHFSPNLASHEEDSLKKLDEKKHSFQTKVLSGSHFLDIIKITTSRSPFIVSIGLDHKVLIWSPLSQPIPMPSQLPLSTGLWPITNVVLSSHGNYIAAFSKSGVVQCWSRLSMTWIWRFELEILRNSSPLEAFFRHKTVPAFAMRKRREMLLSQTVASPPTSRRNSMRSITSPHLGATTAFGNNANVTNELEDFVIILQNGDLLTISCQEGKLTKEKLSNTELVSCAKLITPRVNDRLVSLTKDGQLLVSTAVNNKWRSRFVTVETNRFNNPNSLISAPQQPSADYTRSEISIVPFVGFMVRTAGTVAELVDVQTGILIKSFSIMKYKRGSFCVFHDQPTHCRFCGSVSLASFSVAYTLANTNTVVVHTFTVDHRAKTSICLRVERDPREIRCVGFEQVTEHVYQREDVEGWCVTDTNQVMGVKRRSNGVHQNDGLRRRRAKTDEKDFDLWEGWVLKADGEFDTYDIPSLGNSEGLLVNSVSQVAKFGHKSIVVAFGNIMKVLYLGNDDLVHQDDDKQVGKAISGLSFVEKRRRHLGKKNSRSTNYTDVDGAEAGGGSVPHLTL